MCDKAHAQAFVLSYLSLHDEPNGKGHVTHSSVGGAILVLLLLLLLLLKEHRGRR